MAPLELKKYPQKVLRKRCESLSTVSGEEKALFRQMLFTMRHFSGIGLAAPQVGILKKLIVAEVQRTVIQLANPEIVDVKGTDTMQEGCLSVPGIGVEVERPYEVVVRGLNERGQAVEIKAKGLLARVLQHETDHLYGKLIIDYLPFWKRLTFRIQGRV